MFTVYVLTNKVGKRYVGHTSDVKRRLNEHNNTGIGFTSKHRPWVLSYTEEYESRSEAMIREKFLKTGKGREFIDKLNLGD
jgi:putative endonuclease